MKINESPDEKLKRLFNELGEAQLPATPNAWEAVQTRLQKHQSKQNQQGAFSMPDVNSPASQMPLEKIKPATTKPSKNSRWQGALTGLTGLMLILIVVTVLAALDTNKSTSPGAKPGQSGANPVVPATISPTLARPTSTLASATISPTLARPTSTLASATISPTLASATVTPTLAQPTAPPLITTAPSPTKIAVSPTPNAPRITAGTAAPTVPVATTQEQFRAQALAFLGAGWLVKESGTIELEGTRFYVLAYKPADPQYIQQFSSDQIVSASEAAIVQQNTKGQPYIALTVSVKERILRTSKVCLSKLPEDSTGPTGIKVAGLAIPSGHTPPAGIKVQLGVVWVDPQGTPLNQGLGAYWDVAQQDYRLYIAAYIAELRPEYCK